MKGQVLNYSIQENFGIITSQDGARFNFAGSEWQSESIPTRGLWVDFEASGNNAISIYSALSAGSDVTKRSGKSKATTTLLALFLGTLGAHKFYLGSWGAGIVYIFITLAAFSQPALALYLLVLIVTLVELVHYILLDDENFYARLAEYESKSPGPFGFFW